MSWTDDGDGDRDGDGEIDSDQLSGGEIRDINIEQRVNSCMIPTYAEKYESLKDGNLTSEIRQE
jgi:hypothetical protein